MNRIGTILARATAVLLWTVIVASAETARAEPSPVDVAAGWEYRVGDSPIGADGRPAWLSETEPSPDWKPMPALGTPAADQKGFFWLRIPLPKGDWRAPTLFVGSTQGGAAEFYTTHKLFQVGTIHPEDTEDRVPDGWSVIPIDREDLGHHVFVRLQQNPTPGGIKRALRLGDRGDHLATLFAGGIPPLMVTGILLLLALVCFMGFLMQREEIYLLYCGLFALSSATLVLALSDTQQLIVDSQVFWTTASIVGALFMVPALGAFIATAILKGERPAFVMIVRGLFALAAIGSLACLSDPTLIQRHTPALIFFIVGGVLFSMAVGVQEALRGDGDARVFSVGVVTFFIVVAIDSLSVLGYLPTKGFHTYLGLLGLTVSLVIVVVRRFLMMRTALEQHMKEAEGRHGVLARLSSRLAESAQVLVGAVARLRQVSNVQNDVVDRQAATLQEILATAQEINQAARIAAEKATAIMSSASQADEANQSVSHAVEEGLGGISAMVDEVSQMATRIRALEQRTRQIAGIVDTVKDLADQSNMLALNAAIEAVRSGEAGKGFVVVAREMRSLADLSLQATGRIREVLASVNDGIREAADLTERSEGRIQASLRQLQGSGQQLRTLSQIVHDSNGNVRQISAAIGQQSAGVSQVFTALNDLSRQMDETLERLRETRDAAASVERVAADMSAALADSKKGFEGLDSTTRIAEVLAPSLAP